MKLLTPVRCCEAPWDRNDQWGWRNEGIFPHAVTESPEEPGASRQRSEFLLHQTVYSQYY